MSAKKNKYVEKIRLYAVSLGCPKNLVNTEMAAGALLTSGAEFTFDPEEATLYLINTCAFLASARNEAFAAIEEGVEWKNSHPGGKLVVAGCLVSHPDAETFKSAFPEVDLWAGPNELEKIAPPAECAAGVPVRVQFTLPHVAYLKIADGCDNRCSYCLIPTLRGDKVSRSIASVAAEAEMLVKSGVKELILIAQDTTAFGNDGENLAGLLRELDKLPGDFRVRILYTHPAHYTDELISVMAESRRFIPALDIPLQHISDRMLKKMNRHTSAKEIKDLIVKLRAKIPGVTIRTTFISGFPGETEKDHQQLLEFAAEMRFERLGVFAFSPEKGTPAADMPDQIAPELAARRANELMRRQHLRNYHRNRKLIGQEIMIMADEIVENYIIGRTDGDAPEIDQLVYVPFSGKAPAVPGERTVVKISGILPEGDIEGTFVKGKKKK